MLPIEVLLIKPCCYGGCERNLLLPLPGFAYTILLFFYYSPDLRFDGKAIVGKLFVVPTSDSSSLVTGSTVNQISIPLACHKLPPDGILHYFLFVLILRGKKD
jgi:hypothetical protein